MDKLWEVKSVSIPIGANEYSHINMPPPPVVVDVSLALNPMASELYAMTSTELAKKIMGIGRQAEEIESLQSQRDQLREALKEIADLPSFMYDEAEGIARAALKATEEG